MNIAELIQHFEAQLVGGRLKAIINGVHTFIADIVDGNPILTAAGHEAVAALSTQDPHIVAVAENLPGAVEEVTHFDPALVAAELSGTAAPEASLAPVVAAVVKPVAEKAAVEGVDAVLDDVLSAATTKAKAKAAPKAAS